MLKVGWLQGWLIQLFSDIKKSIFLLCHLWHISLDFNLTLFIMRQNGYGRSASCPGESIQSLGRESSLLIHLFLQEKKKKLSQKPCRLFFISHWSERHQLAVPKPISNMEGEPSWLSDEYGLGWRIRSTSLNPTVQK